MKKEINMRKQCKEGNSKAQNLPAIMAADNRINTDPDGTWTGVSTENCYDEPVQDVDDL